MMRPAPLHGETMRLAAMILRLTEDPVISRSPLSRRLQEGALRLLDHVVLALAGIDRQRRLAAADAELQTLRAHLLLALEMRMLEEDRFMTVAESVHHVGRQLGGWIKKIKAQSA
ncbi:MAG: four helix bundle protein [Magnetococcales bacterium]|nr:four helix bundle protein [Magnetococcales bacterium]